MDAELVGKFEIRKARSEDVPAVKSLERDSGLSPWGAANYEAKAADPDWIFTVASKGSETVGFCLARLITKAEFSHEFSGRLIRNTDKLDVRTEVEICNIAIKRRYRRKGIASRLIRDLLLRLAEFEEFSVFLEVRKSNQAARRFYERSGFVESGKRNNYYQKPPEDAIVMEYFHFGE